MKIFFLASNASNESLRSAYGKIIKILQSEGHEVFSQQTIPRTEEIERMTQEKNEIMAKKFFKEMLKCNCIVFEGTLSTTGGGYYLYMALQHSMPVLYLSQNEYKGLFLASSNRLLKIKRYYPDKLRELKSIVQGFIKFTDKKKLSNRFNLMISDSMSDYLNKVSEELGVSKADFIRDLVYKKMEE